MTRNHPTTRLTRCLPVLLALALLAPPVRAQDAPPSPTTEPLAIIEVAEDASVDARDTDLPTPLTRADFEPCPVEELRASWQVLLPEGEAQVAFATEEEVLRLCRERQAVINEIIEHTEELPALLGNLRGANTAGSQPTPEPAPVIPVAEPAPVPDLAQTDPVTDPVSLVAEEIPASRSEDLAEETPAALNPMSAISNPAADHASVPTQAIWDHWVRFIVRAGEEAWQARIVSIRTPPPTATTDEAGNRMILPASPDPARLSTVTAGDELPDGSMVTMIGADGVRIRDPDAMARAPRRLLSEPVPELVEDAAGFIVWRIGE